MIIASSIPGLPHFTLVVLGKSLFKELIRVTYCISTFQNPVKEIKEKQFFLYNHQIKSMYDKPTTVDPISQYVISYENMKRKKTIHPYLEGTNNKI